MNDGGYAKEIRKKEEGPSIHQTETESEGRVESSLGEGERQYHTPPGPRLASLVSLKSGEEEEEEERSFFIRFIRDAQGTTTISKGEGFKRWISNRRKEYRYLYVPYVLLHIGQV